MSLAALANGADCGPINPLQGLAKNFGDDRGLQQDHFGASRAGPSRGTFRTTQGAPAGFGQEATHFFAGGQNASPVPPMGQSHFDLAALRTALPAPSFESPQAFTPAQSFSSSVQGPSWASDFLVHSNKSSAAPSRQAASPQAFSAREQMNHSPFSPGIQPQLGIHPMSQMSALPPNLQTAAANLRQGLQIDQQQMDNAFQSFEQTHTPVTAAPAPVTQVEQSQSTAQPQDADLLARTAGLLVQSVDHEKNPKFANSQFLGLMKQLRDRTVIVEGNDIVAAPSDWQMGQGQSFGVSTDLKGKGKAVPSFSAVMQEPGASQLQGASSSLQQPAQDALTGSEEDPNEAYFRQDNEDYISYWKAHQGPRPPGVPSQEWQQLQRDWERFEATATGMRPLAHYEFQSGNPYLLGERSYNHTMHGGATQTNSYSESVLQMEAVVQRDPNNARAWFELGVKQQENEREQQAIQALQRALELDPTHLPSWLALAISYTNEGDRQGTYQAVQSWVEHNTKYRGVVEAFEEEEGAPIVGSDEFQRLIGCLIAMARGVARPDEVDADVQIALAVLLNTNEDYARAQDCFQAALSVRPEDWLLYNRVGATLANGGRADEAISYYYKALEINPAYIRARFNLGISCINLRRYEEAAQHILDALVLQDSDGPRGSGNNRGVTSYALWDSLKTTCLHMQRIDLATMCDTQDLEGIRNQLF
ncbi:hypothetical protein BC834DRAFT_867179 [Gloeopeniophorella convolvens]|nr:hypothetical protein BC834DRAFT_867179 [Gloeopeniophorella convolvens]